MTNPLQCWNCGNSLDDVPRPISQHEQCKTCFEALHCCRLCLHFRSEHTPPCDEDRADPPVIKENANFCDWFRPNPGAFSGKRVDKSEAAADHLNALFSSDEAQQADSAAQHIDQTEASTEEQARRKLDDLFSNNEGGS